MNDDPREVLALLNSLGFVGITAEQLKGFMKDLKLYRKAKEREKLERKEEMTRKIIDKQQRDIRRILREQRKQFCSIENSTSTESRNSYVESPVVKVKVHCMSDDKENRKSSHPGDGPSGTRQSCDVRKPKISPDPYQIKSTSTSCGRESTSVPSKTKKYPEQTKSNVKAQIAEPCRPMSAPNILEHEQERVGSSQTKSVGSTKTSGTKSFIRPWRLQPDAQKASNSKKSDPVALYQKYQQEWKQMSFPGEAKHAGLRWAIREKMLGGDPHPMPLPRKSTSLPTLKKK